MDWRDPTTAPQRNAPVCRNSSQLQCIVSLSKSNCTAIAQAKPTNLFRPNVPIFYNRRRVTCPPNDITH